MIKKRPSRWKGETMTIGINSRTTMLRRRHGHMNHQQQTRIGQLRDALHVTLKFCPKTVKDATAPLLRGSRAPEIEAEKVETVVEPGDYLRADLAGKGFFGRVAFAVRYVFCGIGGW